MANRTELKSKQNKLTNLLLQTVEIARLAATAAIEKQKQKEELHLPTVSENVAAKIKNDYIKFIKKGVLNGSIKSVLPDSGASLSTGKSTKDYVETGEKLSKEFQSALGEVKNQPIS